MELFLQNKETLFGLLVLAFLFLGAVFIFYPKKIKEWLIWACSQAELVLGSGTGMLKLREVYDMFTKQYPLIAKIVPFSVFKKWTEQSLKVFKDWLQNNPQAQEMFGGGSSNEEK